MCSKISNALLRDRGQVHPEESGLVLEVAIDLFTTHDFK